MEAYKAEMLMQDIPEERRLVGFAKMVTSSIHTEVLELQFDYYNWSEFEERLLQRYSLNDSLRMSKKELMEWVGIHAIEELG